MKKLFILSIQALKKELYVAFMMFVLDAIEKFEIIEQMFAYYVGQLRAAYDELNDAYERFDVDFCTQEVLKADKERITAFRKLRDGIKWFLTFPENEAKTQAAERLMFVVDLYGGANIPKLGETARSAALRNLVEDLEEKVPAEVETLQVGGLVEGLKQAQQTFNEKYMNRAECESEMAKGATAAARTKMDEAYRDFVEAVNLAAKRDAEGKLTGFINLLNVEISRYRTYTGQGQVGSGAGSGAGSDEVVSPSKTVTFKFIGGRIETITAEIGSVLNVPANTEGYKWEPEVTGVMPEKNTTYKEVPIETAEAVATFHFFDHTEEEVRQLVGSVLHAPENTPGYYWDPEVPETMPAEDTSYYELPEEEEQTEPTLYKVRFMKGTELVAEQEYEAGAVIQAPEPPAGYDREEYPYRMPANDITVNAVRQYVPGGGGGSGFE